MWGLVGIGALLAVWITFVVYCLIRNGDDSLYQDDDITPNGAC